MRFDSLLYLLFLPLTWCCWCLTAPRFRWAVLLAASYLFYACVGTAYLPIVLALVTLATYAVGRLLPRMRSDGARSALFWAGVACNLAFLVLLKYLPGLFASLFPGWAPALPAGGSATQAVVVAAGVSFYVFQAISYLADVHLGVLLPETHLGIFGVYLAFFPKLLQGPIERGGSLLPQLRQPDLGFQYDDLRHGAVLFAWGLFKKIVIADRLALLANPVYDHVHDYRGLALLLATYAYALQLYFDFSGYTDMALGAGRIFNLRLTQNFNRPYLATSMADFWRRWHISFSRWLQDYIFKPLQMHLRDWRIAGSALAIFLTFLFCGLWHGNTWNFVVWGAVHGLFLVAGLLSAQWQKRLFKKWRLAGTRRLRVAQVLVTFHLVCFAWVFFRASSLADAWYVISRTFSSPKGLGSMLGRLSQYDRNTLALGLAVAGGVLILQSGGRDSTYLFTRRLLVRWACYYALAAALVFLRAGTRTQFAYLGF